MKVTNLKRIGTTNRFHVYMDEKWYGIFLDECLVQNNIVTDAEFDEETFTSIKSQNDEKVSFDMAICYLEKYSVSSKGIKDYLKKKGFSLQVIEKTVSKLKEYGYADDEVFAKNYFDSLKSSKGKRVIVNKLKLKGISQEIIDCLLENVDEDEELEKAKILAEKFALKHEKSTKTFQKCIAHLIYKGYDYSVAQEATKHALRNYEGENYDRI